MPADIENPTGADVSKQASNANQLRVGTTVEEPTQVELDRVETTVNVVDAHDWDGANPRRIETEQLPPPSLATGRRS